MGVVGGAATALGGPRMSLVATPRAVTMGAREGEASLPDIYPSEYIVRPHAPIKMRSELVSVLIPGGINRFEFSNKARPRSPEFLTLVR